MASREVSVTSLWDFIYFFITDGHTGSTHTPHTWKVKHTLENVSCVQTPTCTLHTQTHTHAHIGIHLHPKRWQ